MAADAAPDGPAVLHIVQLVDEPIAAYPGGRSPATRPRWGGRLAFSGDAVRQYREFLDRRRNAVLAALPGVRPVYSYRWTLNGFAASLTPSQVAAARRLPGVRSVVQDTVHTLDGADAGSFLGLPEAWRSLGGPSRAGAGVVVGVVDTGISAGHPSFLGARPAAARFTGVCDAGRIVEFRCRGAVAGARWYLSGLGRKTADASDPRSPDDVVGHGTHVASVAAGSSVPTSLGAVSGVAPAARIAAYKACWQVKGEATCATSDTVAAVDQAVADGVDVLNVSIDGAAAAAVGDDPLATSLYRAAQAGVFVAASAGNDGPSGGTAHGRPWLTTVGAGTFDRRPVAAVRLGDGTRLVGAGLGAGVGPSSLVAGGSCRSLDPSEVRGRVVLCVRGGTTRLEKSAEVSRAGGVGMVLANASVDEVDADRHAVPTVHVDVNAYRRLREYLRSASRPTVALEAGGMRASGVTRPEVAEFSARGPDGDALAPDLLAPGVDVLAAVPGSRFGLRSGTSVATPQVAGAAALLRGRYPRWSPAAVKSALVTSAAIDGIVTQGGEIAGPSEYGAGALSVTAALDPGLVFNSAAAATAPYSGQNTPSITIGALAGVRTVRRTVTNVGDSAATYTARIDEPPGVEVTVSPKTLTLEPGERASFAVTLHRVSAPYDQLAAGSVTWVGGDHRVRMPVAVTPVVVTVPSLVALGSSLTVVPGFTGRLSARVVGPVPAVGHFGRLRVTGGSSRFVASAPAASDQVARFTVKVPRDTAVARFALDPADYPVGTDVDLYVYRDGRSIGRSGGSAARERVDLSTPKAGTYEVFVRLVTAPGVAPVAVRMDSYVVSDVVTDAEPTAERSVTAGKPIRMNSPGPATPGRWLGQISWTDGGTAEATTLLTGTTD